VTPPPSFETLEGIILKFTERFLGVSTRRKARHAFGRKKVVG